ncbi:NAD(P)H-dependent oxidoreductase (plasmid) [Geminicoccaceae bacterium 1502E]|nr:NAD(P)H-dependent oxidoreductase [Geminicoccaceae bacterium 1502E]
MKLLHVDSSALGETSVSRELTAAVVEAQRRAAPGATVAYRDLAVSPPDHLSGELVQVVKFQKDEELSERQGAERALTDELVAEFVAADLVVIGAPMYNFSVPTQLKAWMDRIAQPGRTFRYTDQGAEGLARGKRVIIVSSRGGLYAGTPAEAMMDHQEAYLRAFLGFLGITDIAVVRAEGTALGEARRAEALDAARARIVELFAAKAA